MDLRSQYPVATICQVLDYSHSRVYYESHPTSDDPDSEAEILAIAFNLLSIT